MLSYLCAVKFEEVIRQRSFASPLQKAVLNVIYTSGWLTNAQEQLFQDHDITPQQFNVLRILRGRHPQALCAGEIKDVMLDRNPDLTRLCDRLIKKGLIGREVNEANRRQVLVGITPAGLELLQQLDPAIAAAAQRFQHLTEDEANLLSDLLDKLRG